MSLKRIKKLQSSWQNIAFVLQISNVQLIIFSGVLTTFMLSCVRSITHPWTAERWTLAEGRQALLSLTYGECCRWPCYCQLRSDELLPQCAYVILHSLPIKPSNATQCQSIRFTLHILMDFWVSYTVCYFMKGCWCYLKMRHVRCQDVCKGAYRAIWKAMLSILNV